MTRTEDVTTQFQSLVQNSGSQITDGQLQALKSLATLILREVESLEESPRLLDRQRSGARLNLAIEVKRFEIDLIRNALIRASGNQVRAARMLGTKVTTLNVKIKRLGIDPRGFVSDPTQYQEIIENVL